MNKLLVLMIVLLLLPASGDAASSQIGGKTSPDGKEEILCDLPGSEHLKNTGGMGRGGPGTGAGLCVFTSIEHAGRYQNEPGLIGLQKKMTNEPGGGYPDKVDAMLAKYAPKVVYVQYTGKDVSLLKLAMKTSRMVSVTYGYSPRYGGPIAHMVNLVHLTDKWAAVLDNNFPGENAYEWMPPDEFYRRWTAGSQDRSGWCVILLNPPPPPFPHNHVEHSLRECGLSIGGTGVSPVRNRRDAGSTSTAALAERVLYETHEVTMNAALLCLLLLLPNDWGTVPCALVSAPKYEWIWRKNDPHRYYLYQDGVQIGGYDILFDYYRPYDRVNDRWGQKTEPPIPPPNKHNPPVPADRVEASAKQVEDFGVDYSQIPRTEECSVNGRKCTKERAKHLIESKDGTLTDDSQRLRLTVFGSETERNDVVNKLSSDLKDKLSIQAYAPDHWIVTQRGFKLGPGPTIYLESPDGTVLHRQEGWDGPQSLAKAIERADPNYDPRKDPDLRKTPKPESEPCNPPGCPGWLLHVLNSFLTTVTMLTLYLLTHRRS
jgi:hypothetical protein